ncbi:pre-mRNA splicing factor SLU7 [Sugiyamaella lignohabitans]|uniref:Pre-mRNA-splicing factor SLU7 n=1 Tax=Sugiyamaella lignohabitans TaxID=796027 RepID=A0A167ERR1_9ASCO|nr:pre-mRNA splicing factor SLU7 [Sugiyamaella lignohabitans]ANB14393.1 pre-mRNA splicing factor SLU7 [Sugiyamaella lignohabitans]
MERPRKIGAKFSGKDIVADDVLQDITTTWDSKRDRWNGYDAHEYKKVVERFEEKERQKKADGELEDDDDDELKKTQDGQLGEKVRSLRERGDKAAYLEDLSEDAVEFNPKTRTMRTEGGTINDNGQFERKLSDSALEYENLRQKAEGLSEQGMAIHMEASPTEAVLKLKQLQQEKESQKHKLKQELLEKYGGAEHLAPRPKEVEIVPLEASTVTKSGEDKPGLKPSSIKSRYPEDIYPGNHSSVWGSYWINGKWGFACCHSLVKHSYCLGEKGIEINDSKEEVPQVSTEHPNKRSYDEVSQ